MSQGWALPQHFLRSPAGGHRAVVLAVLVAGIGTPAGAIPRAPSQPPWWVRARAAAERRFTLRAVSFSERQESLRIAAFDQFLEVIDPQTGEAHGLRLPGDPALLNRKFDLRFERQGAGTGLSVALPRWGFVYPTLSLEAAQADLSLDFHDRTESRDSTSVRGRGALFDMRLDLVATPCKRCPLFTVTGYRLEKLPSFDVDREPRFALQGFPVTKDEVQLDREVHEISSLVGYAPPAGRTTSFVGVQHRWTDLDIDDRIAYRGPLSDNRLSSHTRLESEATLAVAGLEVELGPRWLSRLETAVGDGDWSVGIGLAFQPSASSRPTSRIRNARLAREIARLRTEFAQEVASLPRVGWTAAAQALLDRFEKRLLDLLPLPEFDGLQSLVLYRFDEARQLLSAATQPGAASTTYSAHPAYVLASLAVLTQSAAGAQDNGGFFRKIYETMGRLAELIARNDLTIRLCIQTGADNGGRFAPSSLDSFFRVELLAWMYLRRNPGYWLNRATAPMTEESLDLFEQVKPFDTNVNLPISRGLYGYFARRGPPDHPEQIACPPGNHPRAAATQGPPPVPCALLDLTASDFPYVLCTAQGCDVQEQDNEWSGCGQRTP